MGKALTRSGRCRSGIGTSGTTTPAQAERGREKENSLSRFRSAKSLDRAYHHGSRSQRAAAHSSEEVLVTLDRPERRVHLTLRWRGGTLTELDLSLPRMMPRGLHTDEDTISLLRRLAVHYPDDVIAGILNRQGRRTASGERFTALHVGSLRRYRNIPRYEPPAEPSTGQVVPIRQAARREHFHHSPVVERRFHCWRADNTWSTVADSNHR